MPPSQSGRMLVGTFWFFAIVVVATYTGNLIASLAVNTVNLPFESLAEMVQQSKIQWGPASGVAMIMLFRVSPFTVWKSDTRYRKYFNYGHRMKVPISLNRRPWGRFDKLYICPFNLSIFCTSVLLLLTIVIIVTFSILQCTFKPLGFSFSEGGAGPLWAHRGPMGPLIPLLPFLFLLLCTFKPLGF